MEGDGLRLTRNVLNIWWSKNLKDNGVAFKMRLNFLLGLFYSADYFNVSAWYRCVRKCCDVRFTGIDELAAVRFLKCCWRHTEMAVFVGRQRRPLRSAGFVWNAAFECDTFQSVLRSPFVNTPFVYLLFKNRKDIGGQASMLFIRICIKDATERLQRIVT